MAISLKHSVIVDDQMTWPLQGGGAILLLNFYSQLMLLTKIIYPVWSKLHKIASDQM